MKRSYGRVCHSVISMLETMSQTQTTMASHILSSVSGQYLLVMESVFITNLGSLVFFFDLSSMQIVVKRTRSNQIN